MLHGLSIVIIIAALNFVRGRGYIPKPFTSALSGMGVAGVLYFLDGAELVQSAIVGLIVFLGLYLWCGPGWGKYFSAFHGRDRASEEEVSFIDIIGYELMPYPYNAEEIYTGAQLAERNRKRGLICMALRGCFIFPLFAVLALYLNSPAAMIGALVGPLQGPAYYVMKYVPEKRAVMLAEILYGIIIGLGVAFATA